MPIRLPVAVLPVAAPLLLFCAPALAQETRSAPENHVPPPASIEDFAWLVGRWQGEGIGGAPAMESWLPPVGQTGTMVGTFVQADGEGGIMLTEHMYLVEEGDSVVLRLKHFGADLVGWEEKDEMEAFRLVAFEPCAAHFEALTMRCDGEDGYLAAVRAGSGELVFRFTRAD